MPRFRSRLMVRALENRVAPAVFTVLNTNNSGAGSLRQTVLDANALSGADSIVFDALAFATPQTVLLTSVIKISDSLAINAPPTQLTLDGQNKWNLLEINGTGQINVSLAGLALVNGNAAISPGGAIIIPNDDNVTIMGCLFQNNKAANFGGAISLFSGTNNVVTISKSEFNGNSTATAYKGGAVYIAGTGMDVHFSELMFTGNTADEGGAIALLASSSKCEIADTMFSNNVAANRGGSIRVYGQNLLTITNSTIANGIAKYGAGIFAGFGAGQPAGATTVTMSKSDVSGNTSSLAGGGIYVLSANMDFNSCTLSGNQSPRGGGIYGIGAGSNVTVMQSTIANNLATTSAGGGIRLRNASSITLGNLTVMDSTISGNTGVAGGGVMGEDFINMTVSRCTFDANSAGADFGGGLLHQFFGSSSSQVPFASVSDSTFSNNTAGFGAGVSGGSLATMTIRNCTISQNAATKGAGIYVRSATAGAGKFSVSNSTIAFNTASNIGGGVFVQLQPTNRLFDSCIIAKNVSSTDPDFSASMFFGSYNLVGVQSNFTFGDPLTQKSGTLAAPLDPQIDANLDANGSTGPKTHRLLPGSPAINAGANPASLVTDQRGVGYKRAVGQTDIGAYEVQAPPQILSVQINDGTAQRSRVTSLTIPFDGPIVLPANPAAAFELKRQSDGAIVGINASVSGNVVALTFASGPVEFGSLADGRYTLTALASQIGNYDAQLDGDGNGIGGDNYVLASAVTPSPPTNIFRLFGDSDGDGTVAANDFIQFRLALGGNNPIFDFDGDGAVAASDFIQFRLRFGGSI